MCLWNISKDFSDDHMKQTGLNGYVYDISVDHRNIDVDDILGIYKYLMNNIKSCFTSSKLCLSYH